jgi:hypothetical protein
MNDRGPGRQIFIINDTISPYMHKIPLIVIITIIFVIGHGRGGDGDAFFTPVCSMGRDQRIGWSFRNWFTGSDPVNRLHQVPS